MPSTHIIRRQVLEVAVEGTEADGFALQRRLPALCEGELATALERVLDRVAPIDEHWTIDRVDVDVGPFTPDNLDRDLTEAVSRALEKLLRGRESFDSTGFRYESNQELTTVENREAPDERCWAGAIAHRTHAQSVRDAFLHFLRTGGLPWWFHLAGAETLEDAVWASWQAAGKKEGPPPNFIAQTSEAIRSASVRERLVWQFSAKFLDALLAGLSRESAAILADALARFGKLGLAPATLRRVELAARRAAFAAAAMGRLPTAADIAAECMASLANAEPREVALLERIAQSWPEILAFRRVSEEPTLPVSNTIGATARADEAAAPVKRGRAVEPEERSELGEGVFVRSAGLVLLHPFLSRCFEALGIAAQDKLVQPERALCLLHFLATGQRVAPEYDLLLPKLLCNVPFDMPVDSLMGLGAAAEEEAVGLLEAVIRHWDALGHTSIDGLRGTFLVRPGKLSRRESDDLLQVERRSFDVLLDRLPWGIGMVQLPWMNRILSVEWR